MTREKIMEEINNMTNADAIGAWNECAQEMGYDDNVICNNGPEFIDMMYDSPYDAILAVEYGHYSSGDEYATINGCGNLESFNYWTDSDIIDTNFLADWLMDNLDKAKGYGIEEEEEYE